MAKTITVHYNALKEVIENFFDGFNDCACCPLYLEECEGYERSCDCPERIIKEYLEEK